MVVENKTKKTCTKGYSCGLSCINVKLSCTKDGLKGQFVTLTEEYFKKASEPSQQRVVEESL